MKVDISAFQANELVHAIGAAENEGLCDPEILAEFINAVGPLLDKENLRLAKELLGRKFLLLKPLFPVKDDPCQINSTP